MLETFTKISSRDMSIIYLISMQTPSCLVIEVNFQHLKMFKCIF